MKNIILVQHTQSVHHTNGMVGSWTDWPLTEIGNRQANCVGNNLKGEYGGRKFVLYSSDLLRAKQTADIIGKYMSTSPIYLTELRERNLGTACGKSVMWMISNQQHQEKTVDDRMFDDAESKRDEAERVKPFLDMILNNKEDNIMIVSHGDLIGVFMTLFMNLPIETMNNAEMNGLAGGVTILQVNDEGKRIVKKFSDVSYRY